jgi:chemotaxis protein histidine kinase CheA
VSRHETTRRELLDEFRTGTRERIEAITHAWLKLERDISDSETASDLMRQLHSLKGE